MPHHPSDNLYAVVGGHLVAVDVASGAESWRTRLPSGGTYVASLLVRDGLVFVGTKGIIHCFDAADGRVLWTNELKGLGYGTIFLGSSGDTQAAAVAQQQSQQASNQAAMVAAQTAAITAATSG